MQKKSRQEAKKGGSISDHFVTKRKRENNTLYKGKYYDDFHLECSCGPK